MSNKGVFSKNDLVWAKLRGYPWWPAVVSKVKRKEPVKVQVRFIGENTYSELDMNNVQDYDSQYKRLSDT
jgi:hypothetical protein